jgi:hypothetical protein
VRSAMPACFGAVAGKVWPAVRAVVQAAVATSQFCEACLRAATRALRWSRARVRPHKMSGRCLACFRVRRMWVSARSDAACVCMCARGSGNALFEHVFRSCGCHRAAAGLTSSSKDCTASFYIVAEQGIGSRGHALAVGPVIIGAHLAYVWNAYGWNAL